MVVMRHLTCFVGHESAWKEAGILHSDISNGNIMIDVVTELPFLSDWDLCKYKEDLDKQSNEHGRSVS